ncbi:SPOR domain-containing protein [Sphingomonas psychrotolerans]|uniref:SPOR domain-containing protein n=1 Tax=Sphingomonas psychrotolerans TaxID=1327635 RepID=A0ABU3N1X9_9SPHN|nr:SPOR domain-containing protein [Sphingomonas psychrotolerans]MDT8758393.1 SPOR domain-containing protein [Sphingomonas psychrotolerans]
MTTTDSAFPLALRKRPRRRAWLFAAVPALLLAGVIPILGIAQASRQEPGPARSTASYPPSPSPVQVDRPATITLGALIEIQRRARAQRRAMAAAEQMITDLPSSGGWQAQLGAFSSPDAAERQRVRLIEAGVPVIIRRDGALHRLQSLPAERADTEGLCVRAQNEGIDCFVRRAT